MDKLTKILFGIWCTLAVASFVAAFFCPLIPKIIGIVFGADNLLLIGSLVSEYFKAKKAKKEVVEEVLKIAEEEIPELKEEKKKKSNKKAKTE